MRNFKKKTASAVLGGVMVGGLIIAGGSPAAAASCSVTAGYVLKTSSSHVTGYGAWVGSGCGELKMKIQRKVLGVWVTKNSEAWNAFDRTSGNFALPTTCSGTYAWRVWIDGENTDPRTGASKTHTC